MNYYWLKIIKIKNYKKNIYYNNLMCFLNMCKNTKNSINGRSIKKEA